MQNWSKSHGARSALLLPFLLAWFVACPVWAAEDTTEAVDQLTSQAESFRKEIRKTPEETPPKPAIAPKKEKAPTLEEKNGPPFKIRNIFLERNTLLPAKTVDPLLAPFQNKETTWEEIKSLVGKITQLYHTYGYLTSRAYLPPQKTTDGALRIQTLEGKVGKIQVEGNRYFKNEVYTRAFIFHPDHIFRYQDFETGIYRINRQPDREVDGFLLAGEEPGTSDILLKTRETFPIHTFYEFNNRGTKLTYRGRHLVGFTHNNFRGEADTLNATVSLAEEGVFTGGGIHYLYPVGPRTVFSLEFSASESMLVKHLKSAEIKGKALNIVPGVTYHLIEDPSLLFSWNLFFEIKDSKTLIDDRKITFDRMRVLRTGPRLTLDDVSGRSFLTSEIRWGIPDLLGGSDKFVAITAGVARLHRLGASFLYLRADGQRSGDSLTALERYRVGGAFSVRGYPESDTSGDYGFNASAEWNFPLPLLKPPAKQKWFGALFVDTGKSFSWERALPTTIKDKFLLGAGAGLRLQMGENSSVNLSWAYPLGEDSSDKDRPQIHLAARAGF